MNKGEYFDLNYMVSICDGDWRFMKEMIESFLKDAPVIIASMHDHAAKHEWKKIGEAAHKFKTSLMFMGIQSLHAIIREIEKMGNEGSDTGLIPEKIDWVDDICRKAMAELKSFVDSHP